MVDITNTSAAVSDRLEPFGRVPAQGYQTAQEARTRATFTRSSPSAQTISALERLERLLQSDAPLRKDAPRGYYFDGRF
ncbi:MAG: hypothetical protein ACFCUO_08035 [Rhodospirillales bacterium]